MSDTETDDTVQPGINPPVFYPSIVAIGLLVVFAIALPDTAGDFFSAMQAWLAATFGWFYLLCVTAFLVFCIFSCS